MSDDSAVVKAKPQPSFARASVRASDVEFNVHSSCYNDFFLLRTPITINGHPAVIKVVNGEPVLRVSGISVKLSAILQQAVAPVATKHGVYRVDNFYYDQVALCSITFQSKSSLKQFLTDKEAVQNELSSAIANLFEVELIKATQPQSPSMEEITVGVEVYLVSPNSRTSAEIRRVNLANYASIVRRWQESKLFDFNDTMFMDRVCNSG